MILFRVTPQSGRGLHAILLRPRSSPGPWAPGLLIHHFIEPRPATGVGGLIAHSRVSEGTAGEPGGDLPQGCAFMCVQRCACVRACVLGFAFVDMHACVRAWWGFGGLACEPQPGALSPWRPADLQAGLPG